ncbi:MAG: stage II sporulation protein M [Acidimicrobiales bacterium]
MDIDRFIVTNQPAWSRLAQLVARARRPKRLEPAELDELVQLYQRVSAHLSHARAYYGDPGLTARLTALVAVANGVIYSRGRGRPIRAAGRFFTETFPAAVWCNRRFVVVATLLTLVPAVAIAAWFTQSDALQDLVIPPEVEEATLEAQFEDYYSSQAAEHFGTQVVVNNIQVSFWAFALGILVCIPTAYVLATNGINVGIWGGFFAEQGHLDKFFGLILPHGLLELTAIFIAGAAGLKLGWAIIAPGDRTRGQALADDGRRSVVIILGLMATFLAAAVIEAIVTPSGLPTAVRVGIGVAVEAAFLAYIASRGRQAEAAGLTGLLGEERQLEIAALMDQRLDRTVAT